MRRELLIISILLSSRPALALDDAGAFEAVLADGKVPLEGHEKLDGCDFWVVRDTLSSLTRCTDKRAWIFTVSEFEKKPEQILAKHFVLVCRVENDKSLGLATEIYRLKSGKYAGGLAELVGWEKKSQYQLTVQSPFLAQRSPNHPELIKLPDACDPFRKKKR